MSKENRKREYDRLVSLGRLQDIPENLKKEFGSQEKVEIKKPVQIKKKEFKKNG